MAAPAGPPAPVHAASPAARRQRPSLLGWISTKGCSHALKLRHSFKLDAKTRMEIGLDLDVIEDHQLVQMLHSAAPWAAMLYRFDPEDSESKAAVEMTPHWVTYNRHFRLGRKGAWWELPLDAKLGLTYSGSPHIEVGLQNMPIALTLAAGLLVAGMPITVKRKEVGGLAVHFPIGSGTARRNYSLQERVELDASLQREGNGLQLQFNRIDGVLRLREDD